MSAQNFVLDDGLRKYTISNKQNEVFAEFSFNPTDTGIVERYSELIKFFKNLNLDIDEKDDEEGIKTIREKDEEIINKFSELFKYDVKETLFGKYNPCAILGNGDFFCEAIVEIIGAAIESAMDVRIKEKQARINKAIAKYKK